MLFTRQHLVHLKHHYSNLGVIPHDDDDGNENLVYSLKVAARFIRNKKNITMDLSDKEIETLQKMEVKCASPSNAEEQSQRVVEYLNQVGTQHKEWVEKFVAEEEELWQAHIGRIAALRCRLSEELGQTDEDKIASLRRRLWEEEVQLRLRFEDELRNLMFRR